MNPAQSPGSIRTLLLVEDHDSLACGMMALLSRHGFSVLRARNGLEALNVLVQRTVDLVITDVFMDGMDGLETLMHLRKKFPTLPVIAVSGGSRKVGVDCLRMAEYLGADRILRKPVLIADLIEAIEQLDSARSGGQGGTISI